MARERYSIIESWNKILRLFQGETVNELPETIVGEILSVNEALSDLTELLNDSLPGETFALPTAMRTAVINSGFATGTAQSLQGVTGTSVVAASITTFVFGAGISVSVSGTSVFLNA